MADENEDQWLYGDSTDTKEYTPATAQADVQQNDLTPGKVQEKSTPQEDQTADATGEAPPEVR